MHIHSSPAIACRASVSEDQLSTYGNSKHDRLSNYGRYQGALSSRCAEAAALERELAAQLAAGSQAGDDGAAKAAALQSAGSGRPRFMTPAEVPSLHFHSQTC